MRETADDTLMFIALLVTALAMGAALALPNKIAMAVAALRRA
jgi:hypothetical protein